MNEQLYKKKYNLLVLDLDNTLINEIDYLFPAYEAIADYIVMVTDFEKYNISTFLKDEFIGNGRKDLFQKLIRKFQLSEVMYVHFLNILRTVELVNKIPICKPIESYLNKNYSFSEAVIYTNGNPVQQLNKIRQTDWSSINLKMFPPILANLIAPKPDIGGLKHFLSCYHEYNIDDILYIGDSEVDRVCASKMSIDYLDVKDI